MLACPRSCADLYTLSDINVHASSHAYFYTLSNTNLYTDIQIKAFPLSCPHAVSNSPGSSNSCSKCGQSKRPPGAGDCLSINSTGFGGNSA